ncbi:hypothetical protein LB505_004865 [Fusarium chuoi]|nr:hypothetical protein LB505_004865 [Fusarium chuoi]
MHFRDFAPRTALVSSLLAIPQLASAFYLPGVAPTTYKEGDKVPLYTRDYTPLSHTTTTTLRSNSANLKAALNMYQKVWVVFSSETVS